MVPLQTFCKISISSTRWHCIATVYRSTFLDKSYPYFAALVFNVSLLSEKKSPIAWLKEESSITFVRPSI